MAHGDVAFEPFNIRFGIYLRDQTAVFVASDAGSVGNRNAAAFLAAVLEGEQAKKRDAGDV